MRKFKDTYLQKFYDRLVSHSQKELKSWNTYDSGFSYHGLINDDPEQDVWVLWHAANRSYTAIEMRALLAHYQNEFGKIKGLVWRTEWANGNGGADWIVLNLSKTTTAAFREVYESFGDLWNCKDMEDYNFVQDTPEYQEMYDEESQRDFVIWWEDETRGTPYSDLPESYYVYNDCLNWQADDCYVYSSGRGDPTKEAFITSVALKALNAGDLEIDQEDWEEWYLAQYQEHYAKWHENNDKGWWQKYATDQSPWPRIAQGSDGEWALESEIQFINDQWQFLDKRDPERQPKLFGDDDVES